MEQTQLDSLIAWFDTYVQPYLDTDEEGAGNIRLKIEHTRKVCEAMLLLCAGESLSPAESRIAGAVALLHDVGRFPQYRRWRTFRDSDSDNHARLAIDVIREERLLDGCDDHERLLIEEAVRFHNLLEVPGQVKSPNRLFINLIRDADKIDIWRVFTELLALPPHKRASAATLGFADLPDEVSEECIKTLAGGSVVQLDTIRILNDFKLMQISWVYDLNFPSSRRLLRERGHISALASSLPERDDIKMAVAKALASLSEGADTINLDISAPALHNATPTF
ncbi:MAG: HD domain-containing protein [Desulfuromonadales bacterium]